MAIEYLEAEDIKRALNEIADRIGLSYLSKERVLCFRSVGSKARYVTARVHALPRIWQCALETPAKYLVEVISERYDQLPLEEQEKIIIHELLHIPKRFGGGFRHHKGWVTRQRIDSLHRQLLRNRTTSQ